MATSSPTHKTIWSRSIYWRSVISFSACMAVVLLVQAVAVQLWLKSAPDSAQVRAFTRLAAADLGRALDANPRLDVERYVAEQYPRPLVSMFIVLARGGGTVISKGPLAPSDASIKVAQDFYRLNPLPDSLPESWMTSSFSASPIRVNGILAGSVGAITVQSWRQLFGWKVAALSAVLL